MTRRPRKKGGFSYYYQAGGKKIPLGTDLHQAKQEWARLETGGSHAFPSIAQKYRDATWPTFSVSTKAHYETALRNLEKTFQRFTLEQIKPQHVKSYLRKRTKKGAALFEKRVLSAVFNWARGEGHTAAGNPCHGMKLSAAEKRSFGVTGKRERYVTDAEFQAVYSRGDAILQDMMDLALLTGQRPSDLLKARRQDITDGTLWIVQEKTGAKVGIRVEDELKSVVDRILARERPIASMYLISDRRGQRVKYDALNARFVKARGDADWQFRDIRAKAATDSPDLKTAQQLLGHATETTTAGVYRRGKGTSVAPLERKKPA